MNKKFIWACDFETTTKAPTLVWSAAYTPVINPVDGQPMPGDNVFISPNIDEFLNFFTVKMTKYNYLLYFHNLKFDGEFIVSYLLRTGWKYSPDAYADEPHCFNILKSKMGQFYSIKIKGENNTVEIWDSLKLIPMSVAEMGKAFKTKHQKTTMSYQDKASIDDCTAEDIEYIKNDVLVMKEALIEFYSNMRQLGHDIRMTIGSTDVTMYKRSLNKRQRSNIFVNLTEIQFPDCDAETYIRRSYKGGYCYAHRKGKAFNGCTYDVNSLYPFAMHSKSGSRYPVREPHFFYGEPPDEATKNGRVYFVRFKASFDLKSGYLPTVQLKNSISYNPTEYLSTSKVNGSDLYIDDDGNLIDNRPEMTMTSVDFELFKEHYTADIEYLDGCWFDTSIGIFDDFINFWFGKKEVSTGGMRTLCKLFLNNLYGKMSTNPVSAHVEPLIEGDVVKYKVIEGDKHKTANIAIGSFITAYARNYTIRTAQQNFSHFWYADTDSLHLDTQDVKDIYEHPTELGAWKRESDWDEAIFVRQKTYAEHVTKENRQPVTPEWDVKAAGCPKRCKDLFKERIDGIERVKDKTDDERAYTMKERLTIDNFTHGLQIPGKLRPKRVSGGVILETTTFTLK